MEVGGETLGEEQGAEERVRAGSPYGGRVARCNVVLCACYLHECGLSRARHAKTDDARLLPAGGTLLRRSY